MAKTQKAVFAAGCFWGVQAAFDETPGVVKTTVGYCGGKTANPSYEQVCSHASGHAEAVEVEYEPQKISYEKLMLRFFELHDPTQVNRQGPDVGSNYRSAIFYSSEKEKKEAAALISKLNASKKYSKPIATSLEPASTFWVAEDYHQKYYKTHDIACHI
ncbi:Peptide methionine sulfoxide reductase MsrA [uncultured archaeon]|nr:Peptide methionine sulfoxide reductase MsrA [uncultured archaeon]